MPPSAVPSAVDPVFMQTVKEFQMHQFNMQGMAKNKERVKELANANSSIALATQILEDLGWTYKTFGEDQASSRVLAIQVLAERGRLGDLRPLTDVAAHMALQFEDLDSGRRADLRDLITEWIPLVGVDRFFDNPSVVMQNFANPAEVRKTVIAASVAHLGQQINDPGFIQRMARWK